jgi:uncharacterized protein (TIGR02145 family)
MNKTLLNRIMILLLFHGLLAHAQVGIGTSNPNKGAVLDLTSSSKGFLLPRVANTAAIVNPVNGMLIYDTSADCLKSYQKGAWTDCGLVPIASVATLNCSAAFNPVTTKPSVAYTGSTTSSYTGGNGAAYPAASYTSTGITGLTLSLAAGTLATGSGTLSYTVSGTPSGDGTASFSISFGGQTCTKTLIVATCGAYVAPGVFKEFMCHNLGADTSLDPNIPAYGIHGNYYQWGRATIVADASTPDEEISGWNTTYAPEDSWSDNIKTSNDPCPSGYRLPTKAEWQGVLANNVITYVSKGSSDSAISFSTGSTKTLTLPATGSRHNVNGDMFFRSKVNCWSSTIRGGLLSWFFNADTTWGMKSVSATDRNSGFAVRCISE